MSTRDLTGRLLVRGGDPQADATRLLMFGEIRRTLRSPLLWSTVAVTAWLLWGPWLAGRQPRRRYGEENFVTLFTEAGMLPLAAFLLGAWTIARERPSTTEELFAPAPVTRWRRTAATLPAAVVPTIAAVLVVAVQAVLVNRAGGVAIGVARHPMLASPSLGDWVLVPAATLAAYMAGAAVYTMIRSRTVAALVGGAVAVFGVLAYWIFDAFPLGLISPLGNPGVSLPNRAVDGPSHNGQPLTPSADHVAGWDILKANSLANTGHAVYLFGAALLFAALALTRTAPHPWNLRLAWVGAAAAVFGCLVQVTGMLPATFDRVVP